MANELIFNLDLDLTFPLSDYAFSSGNVGVLYFRAFRNNYIQNWETTDKLTFTFEDKADSNIRFVHELDSSDIVTIDSEDLFKLTLNSAMTAREGVYNGTVSVNNSTQSLKIDIIIFTSTSIEMSTLLQITRSYQEELTKYLETAKKDMLDAPNGLALLDQNKKMKESYLPTSYRNHINTEISKSEAHQVKIDDEGIAWFLNGSTWEQWAGQPSQSTITPPTIIVKDGRVTVSYDPKQTVARQKWAEGDRAVTYFVANGTTFTGSTFLIKTAGVHTLYYRDGQGKDYVQTFTVLETDIPYPLPKIKVTNGVVNITQHDPSKVIIQKWAQGVQDIAYFQTGGTVINNSRFNVSTVGTYSLYYKLTDGREYIMSIIVDDSMLPQIVLPKVEVRDGIVTITHDPSTNVSESKWDFGTQSIAHFTSNGFVINNNTFEVYSAGKYTLYFKTTSNEERVMTFDVDPSQLKADPAVDISITNGVATVSYPSNIRVSLSKWSTGSRSISYFANNGTTIINDSFTVAQIGVHTLYYKTSEGKEYVKEFTVALEDLPPSIIPQYSLADGNLNIVVKNESLYSANRFTWQRVGTDYFEGGGVSSQVINWKIPLTQKGWLTHYYKTDTDSGVYQIEIKNEDLPNVTPTITVKDGLVRVTHAQPAGVTVTDQKWSIDNKTISFFQSGGVNVIDNKFYVVNAGVHTLYYRLSHGGEYVVTFNVTTGQLEKPVNPPTISTVMGVVTPVFDASLDIAIKKWGLGILAVPYFQTQGTVFTNTFQVSSAGQYTIYIKLGNDREYVYPFTVTEEEMQQAFIPPVIDIVKGKATVTYDPSLDVLLSKWAYGNNSIPFFETGGSTIVDNKFTVTTAGQHTLYTVLVGDSKNLTPFTVSSNQLPNSDSPPKITVANGVATIELDSTIIVAEQKWAKGGQDKEYFQTGGTAFTGNTFNVLESSIYSYYYKNSYDEEYVYHFFVDDSQLPFYPATITVFDALLTVEYSSPIATQEAKIASGNQTVEYFATSGDVVVNNQHPITAEGLYTFYWKQEDGREFIEPVIVNASQLEVHTPPTITVEGSDITVDYVSETEALVTEKKYGTGQQTADWFVVNGTVVTSNEFTVTGSGAFTYFYKYRNRGYVLNFTIADASWIHGFIINESGINPTNSVTYTDDSVGLAPATRVFSNNPMVSYNGWTDKAPFNQIKPCVFDNVTGKVKYYLNPNNYTQKLDGSPSIIDGSDGDVMVEFPKIYWKVEKTGTNLSVKISNKQVDPAWKCYGHMQGSTEYKYLYVSAYPVWNTASGIKSASGVSSPVSISKANYLTTLQQRNSGYNFISFHSYSLLQMLSVLFFKTRDLQENLGYGKVTGTGRLTTGHSDAKGLFTGNIDTEKGVKILGIEDLWGSVPTPLNGLYSSQIGQISWNNENFNEDGTGYKASGFTMPVNPNTIIDKMTGTTELPFVPISVYSTTNSYYYSDKLDFPQSLGARLFSIGGAPTPANSAGLFAMFGVAPNGNILAGRITCLSN